MDIKLPELYNKAAMPLDNNSTTFVSNLVSQIDNWLRFTNLLFCTSNYHLVLTDLCGIHNLHGFYFISFNYNVHLVLMSIALLVPFLYCVRIKNLFMERK